MTHNAIHGDTHGPDGDDPIPGGPSGGAPADATYLVTTSNAELSNEVVVGTTPAGELGGTWASPTVDASHSGSTHAATQAAAEATAAGALSSHAAIATVHHNNANDPTAGEKAALAGTTGTPGVANQYVTTTDSRMSDSRAPSGGASGELGGTYPSPTVNATHSGSAHVLLTANTPTAEAFGDTGAVGVGAASARDDHRHAMPANPVTAHEAAADPHAVYQLESQKGSANGYAALDAGSKVAAANLPSLDGITAAAASVNFNGQQATSFRVENRTSDPGTPTTGQIWLRTDL